MAILTPESYTPVDEGLMRSQNSNFAAVRDLLLEHQNQGKIFIAGDAPLILRRPGNGTVETATWLIAPPTDTYSATELQTFRKSLFEGLTLPTRSRRVLRSIDLSMQSDSHSNNNKDGSLYLGWTAFDDELDRTTTEIQEDKQTKAPGAFYYTNREGLHPTTTQVLLKDRRTFVIAYPNSRLALAFSDMLQSPEPVDPFRISVQQLEASNN